jgi:cellulose synthase/poly-beta-1,6-N-acetylglucosamine synthase-like glycosyltransferase
VIWLAGFWGSVALVGYVLAGFPLLVLVRGAVRPARTSGHGADGFEPSVSVVIAAHNEASCIRAKVERLLAIDYPADRLEVVVASDGSDDGTTDEVAAIDDPRVRLLSLPRGGKAAALNAAVATSSGEVLVFTDANSWFAHGALRALVGPLADPAVGGVAGDQRYRRGRDDAGVSDGEVAYWSVDRWLKGAESRAGSTVSATGAIYAVRRELVEEVPPDVTDDFFISTGVIAAGRRLVFAPQAVAYESVAPSVGLEFSRKVRIMTRGLTGVRRRAELLDPRRTGFYAVQLFSHKVLRRLLAMPALVSALCLVRLRRRHLLYRAALVGETGFLAAGAVGIVIRSRAAGRARLLTIPAYTCLVNAAALRACWNVVRGRVITRWEPPAR